MLCLQQVSINYTNDQVALDLTLVHVGEGLGELLQFCVSQTRVLLRLCLSDLVSCIFSQDGSSVPPQDYPRVFVNQ